MKSIEERISNSTMTANSDSMLPNKRSSITDLEILTSSEIHSPALKKRSLHQSSHFIHLNS